MIPLVWLCARACEDTSQYGQTTALLQLRGRGAGTFIEFGCADGRSNSNTHMLECLGWRGICIEPVDTIHGRQHGYAGAVCEPDKESVDIVVASVEGLHGVNPDLGPFGAQQRDVKRVKCYNLHHLRKQHDLGNVTYMTVDTEGNEAELLQSYKPLDWVTWLQVECNHRKACSDVRAILGDDFMLKRFVPFNNGRKGGDLLFRSKTRVD